MSSWRDDASAGSGRSASSSQMSSSRLSRSSSSLTHSQREEVDVFKMPGQVDTVKEYFASASQPVRHRPGKRVNNQMRPHAHEEWDFLKSRNEPQWRQQRGLQETRFHKGFERRKYAAIEGAPPRSCENTGEPFKPAPTARKEALAYLKGQCTGYNIITGDRPATSIGVRTRQLYPSYGKPADPRGRRHFEAEQPRPQTRCLGGANAQLKFFQEHKASEASQERQSLLAKDGLSRSVKRSSVLGYGRGDLSSRGVADNFQLKQL